MESEDNDSRIKDDIEIYEDSTISDYDEIRIGYKSDKKGFLDSLKKKAETIKDKSVDLGKTTARGAEDLGSKLDSAFDESVNAAKGLGTSKNETLDLIERLAMMKEKGILTEKEFAEKKKDLLEKI